LLPRDIEIVLIEPDPNTMSIINLLDFKTVNEEKLGQERIGCVDECELESALFFVFDHVVDLVHCVLDPLVLGLSNDVN
jgi:hypothetical protein